ncbi:MAG: chromate transporter [Candidatus Eremiobacteraeota bacterium]|nr:chromate transporter [Candidatus Eremiobacteraeota bacterium]
MSVESKRPGLAEIALTFASISSTAFGGGQKASVRQQVLNRGWMDHERFMDGLEIAQVLPGPNILNLALYCGQRVRGVPGAVAAFLGASIPPFIIVLIAGALYFKFSTNPYVHGALRGCAAGALGLTIANALDLSWDERADWIRLLLVAITALAVSLLKMPLLLVLVAFGGAGIAREYLSRDVRPRGAGPNA